MKRGWIDISIPYVRDKGRTSFDGNTYNYLKIKRESEAKWILSFVF